jgi:hypothetical protein
VWNGAMCGGLGRSLPAGSSACELQKRSGQCYGHLVCIFLLEWVNLMSAVAVPAFY